MGVTFFIPKKINVGFQKREGTYTGKLAYIIYFDEKGKLRKENSWNSWRHKDIDNEIFENEPTSGFVLNKKAGGYDTGWNHRQTYVRVYDPRGFEFEITVPNLLYILENATSTKGKGLEGDFVYGWDGKDLILIPCDSPDYKEISSYSEKLQNQVKLKGKDLKIGGTYLTKSNKEIIYLCRSDVWGYDYEKDSNNHYVYVNDEYKLKWFTKKKGYFFASKEDGKIIIIQSLSKDIIEVLSEECADNYAELVDKLERNSTYSYVDDTKNEFLDYSLEEFINVFGEKNWGINFYNNDKKRIDIRKEHNGNRYYFEYKVEYERTRNNTYSWQKPSTYMDYRYEKEWFNNLDEVFKRFKPCRKRKYLANGKIYSEGY